MSIIEWKGGGEKVVYTVLQPPEKPEEKQNGGGNKHLRSQIVDANLDKSGGKTGLDLQNQLLAKKLKNARRKGGRRSQRSF